MRGLIVWLGAAAVGAVGGSLLLNLILRGTWTSIDWRFLAGLSAMALMLTTAGSALLLLVFARLAKTGFPSTARGISVIVVAVFAGGLMLSLVLRDSPASFGIGALYAGVTAVAWVSLAKLTNMDSPH